LSVKCGLGFAIPHLHSGQGHEHLPDFIIRVAGVSDTYLILETRGFDDLADVKAAATERWVAAVDGDGQLGTWRYAMARSVPQVRECLEGVGGARPRG
jgi:type III restriction enzyme